MQAFAVTYRRLNKDQIVKTIISTRTTMPRAQLPDYITKIVKLWLSVATRAYYGRRLLIAEMVN